MAAVLAVAGVSAAFAQVRVTTAWDPNHDALTAGYRVFLGTSPGGGQPVLDVGQATSAVLPLPVGAVYYVTVRAYTAQGVLGPPSTEAVIDLVSPPGAPTAVRANVYGANASLDWSPPLSGGLPLGYMLSVGTASGASNLVSGYPIGNTQTISSDLPPGTYFARLQAANMLGIGPPSAEVRFSVGGGYRPLGPSGLAVSWSGTTARLSWTPPTGDPMPTSYVIEAGTTPGGANLGSVNVGNTAAFAVDVPPGTYYVRVRGVGASGVSDPSNEIVLQANAGTLAPPTALAVSGSGSAVNLSWRAPANGAAAAYVLEAGTAPGLSNLGAVNVGNVTRFSTAAPSGVYYVRVRAVDGRGASNPSNEVVVRR